MRRPVATSNEKRLIRAKVRGVSREPPTSLDVTILLKTTKTLGLTVPQSILIRADEVNR